MASMVRAQFSVLLPWTGPRAANAALGDVARSIKPRPDWALRRSSLPFQSYEGAGWHEDDLVEENIRLLKGQVLLRNGQPRTSLFAVRSGSCKSVVSAPGGQQQVTGFHIAGDILGAEAICGSAYDATVTALEDSEFRVMPFSGVEALARVNNDFQRKLHAFLACEIRRERKVSLWLGSMRAEQRLSSFLLDLADRYAARGYSSCEVVLRMSRDEIGGHLGLKQETVSRLFSRLHRDGLIQVQGRAVKLVDRVSLQALVDGVSP
jgi:CRP/FNR family transcriptional regulator